MKSLELLFETYHCQSCIGNLLRVLAECMDLHAQNSISISSAQRGVQRHHWPFRDALFCQEHLNNARARPGYSSGKARGVAKSSSPCLSSVSCATPRAWRARSPFGACRSLAQRCVQRSLQTAFSSSAWRSPVARPGGPASSKPPIFRRASSGRVPSGLLRTGLVQVGFRCGAPSLGNAAGWSS